MSDLFNAVKTILENQYALKFTVDEEREVFICDQFDAPIVLALGGDYEDDTAHIHRLLTLFASERLETNIQFIEVILEHMFQNLFTPILFYRTNKYGILLQQHNGDYYHITLDGEKFLRTVYTKYQYGIERNICHRISTRDETSELDLDFSALDTLADVEYESRRVIGFSGFVIR
jgi:hypothetical protein